MRAAICALMTTLWFTASMGYARNGETGILIVVHSFEFVDDDVHQQTVLLLCSDDLERIVELLQEGYSARIYLKGYGVFEVEELQSGELRLYKKNVEIQSRECHPSKPGCPPILR